MLTAEEIKGIGVALNEATLIGIEINEPTPAAGITFEVLSLAADRQPQTGDRRVQVVLRPIGRVVASLRSGIWNDDAANALPLAIDDLLEVTTAMQGEIYGWSFIDVPEDRSEHWRNRLSLDIDFGSESNAHSMTLFESGEVDGSPRHLDIRIWFDEISIWSPAFNEIPLHEFIAGGRRWWDAFYAGDLPTEVSPGNHIVRLAEPSATTEEERPS